MTSPLANRADYLQAIGAVDAEWSTIEYAMLLLFQVLMGVDAPRAHAVFSELSNHRLRRDILMSVAKVSLDAEEYDTLKRLEKRISRASQKRNAIAHATWAVKGPDVFILDARRNWQAVQIPLSDLLVFQANIRELHRNLIELFKQIYTRRMTMQQAAAQAGPQASAAPADPAAAETGK